MLPGPRLDPRLPKPSPNAPSFDSPAPIQPAASSEICQSFHGPGTPTRVNPQAAPDGISVGLPPSPQCPQ
ncbi:hypothetical protein VZT92_007754 [Zoarces viviparus]|uniref:Uncharacterized protein n=1 Tax=Zoarces viviparus TaxID=48416 RepID=A0AAW1FL33_ZOAVI